MTITLTVAICTKDREQTLRECVSHATAAIAQAGQPRRHSLMIVDDGQVSDECLSEFKTLTDSFGIDFVYLKKSKDMQRGLYGSRRVAVKNIATSHVLFIDDDCMVEPDYVNMALGIVSARPDLVALTGVDRRNLVPPTPVQLLLWKFFLMSGGREGRLSLTGFNYGHAFWLERKDDFECDFVHGCNMLFAVDALREMPACAWLEGHSVCEDLVLAHTAARLGCIIVSPRLNFEHLETPGGRGGALTKLQRKLRSHFKFHRMKNGWGVFDLLFIWSTIGVLCNFVWKQAARRFGLRVHLKS
jgi:glycosyltransferase involved in cell wall biosynthesis